MSQKVLEISSRLEAVCEDVRHYVSGNNGRHALETGGVDAGLVWPGQVQGLIHDVPTCRELIDRIMGEADRSSPRG